MAPAQEEENEEEAEQRKAEFAQRRKEYEEEQKRLEEVRAASRKADFERQQKEYEAETKRREKEHKARLSTLERIVEHAPAILDATQLRIVIELLLNLSTYGLFEDAAEYFVGNDENHDKTEDEILTEALANCAEDKLTGFLLRLVLTESVMPPRGEQPDWLTKAESVFAPPQPKFPKQKTGSKSKATPTLVKAPPKKSAAKKKAAA